MVKLSDLAKLDALATAAGGPMAEMATAAEGVSKRIADLARVTAPAERTLARLAQPASEARDRMLTAAGIFGEDSPLLRAARGIVDSLALERMTTDMLGAGGAVARISEQIERQERALDAFRPPSIPENYRPPSIPEIRLPPNPIHETNKRLAGIERRFNRLEEIVIDGAKIGTALQATATDFLVKFETAATDSARTARRSIRIGVVAMIVAVAILGAQIVYTEFWRAPSDAVATQAVISELRDQMSALQATQDNTAERLAAANERVAAILGDIQRLLAEGQTEPSTAAPVAGPDER